MSQNSKSNWTKGLFGAIIIGLITSFIYDWIKEKPILSTISSAFKLVSDIINKILNIDFKLWWILLIVFIIKLIQKVYKTYKESNKSILPDNLENYTQADFKNWKWKWNWSTNEKKWIIKNLWPYCKSCDIKLLDKSDIINSAMQCNVQNAGQDLKVEI